MHLSRTVSYVDELELTRLDGFALVSLSYRGPARRGGFWAPGPGSEGEVSFLVSDRDLEVALASQDPFGALESAPRYSALTDEGVRWFTDSPFLGDLEGGVVSGDDLAGVALSGLGRDRVVRVDFSSHLFYSLDADLPRSRVYSLEYIGGISDDVFDLDVAERVLDASDLVLESSRMRIPAYNADVAREALEVTLLLPQWMHDDLVRHFRDGERDQCWSTRIPECLVRPPTRDLDLLGLAPARLSTEAADRLRRSRSGEDDRW